jgi:GT2 family glycosyltransferase
MNTDSASAEENLLRGSNDGNSPVEAIAQSSNRPASRTVLVSLVVASVNRVEEIWRLFKSLAMQSNSNFEIVLIDQNNDDRLVNLIADYASSFPIRHLRSVPGLSRSRNVGLHQCRGEIIGFPDDDCWYPKDTVDRVTAIFRATPDVDAITGRTVDAEGVESLGHFQNFSSEITRSNVWWTHNSNTLFVRSCALQAINGFDESLGAGAESPFQSGEETDLLLNIMQQGGRAQFHWDLTIFHDQVGQQSVSAMLRRARTYSPGFGRVLRKHSFGLPYLGYRVARTFVGAALAALRMNPTEARYKMAWALGTIEGYFASPNARVEE